MRRSLMLFAKEGRRRSSEEERYLRQVDDL